MIHYFVSVSRKSFYSLDPKRPLIGGKWEHSVKCASLPRRLQMAIIVDWPASSEAIAS